MNPNNKLSEVSAHRILRYAFLALLLAYDLKKYACSHASSHLACVLAYCVIVVGLKNDPYKK